MLLRHEASPAMRREFAQAMARPDPNPPAAAPPPNAPAFPGPEEGGVALGLAALQALSGKALAARRAHVDPAKLENHLEAAEFASVFGMGKAKFYQQPKWKQISQRKKHKLF